MKNDDFDAYDDPTYDLSDSVDDEAKKILSNQATHATCSRRRLDELLEEKQLRQELKEYDDCVDNISGSYYADSIYDDYY